MALMAAEPQASLEGYCIVFEKNWKSCELEVVRSNNSEPDILRVKNQDDHAVKSLFKSMKLDMNDLLKEIVELKELHQQKEKKYCIEYRIHQSEQHIYVILSCEESIIETWAEERTIDVPIDARKAITIAKKELPNFLLAQHTITPPCSDDEDQEEKVDRQQDHKKDDTKDYVDYKVVDYKKWKNIHIGFESALHSTHVNLYAKPHHTRTLKPVASAISHVLYLRILYQILTDDQDLGGAGFQVEKYLNHKSHPLCHFFALHQPEAKQQMTEAFKFNCVACSFDSESKNAQFLNGVRRYYGEQIAFYFAFLVHYTAWLYPLAIIGAIWWMYELANGEVYDVGSLFAVLVIIMWSTLMIENWYRREWQLRYRWGMMRYKTTEVPRPAFVGMYQISSVSGMRVEEHRSKCCYWARRITSVCISFICVLLVVLVTVFIWEIQNRARVMDEYLSVAIGMINSVQIQIFNIVYVKLAVCLNDWEGHRLEEEYYNQLVIKRISFIVINSFYSLFFIAFFDTRAEYEDDTVRLKALRTQLVVLFAMAIIYQNTLEACGPACGHKLKECCCCGCCKKKEMIENEEEQELITSQYEHNTDEEDDEYKEHEEVSDHRALEEDDEYKDILEQSRLRQTPDVLDNTAEIIVLHGYVTLFIVVFPLMPLLGVINNWIELKVDKGNLLCTQRPVPWSAGGLGVWSTVLTVFAVVSIYSNLALVTFRTNLIIDFLIAMEDLFADIEGVYWTNEDMVENQVTFFFVSTTFFVFVVVAIRMCIPPISSDTAEDIARQEICQRQLLHISRKEQLQEL